MTSPLEVEVNGDIEKAFKNLKKRMAFEGIFKELKKRRYYEKPSAMKKRKKEEAERRRVKKMRRFSGGGMMPTMKKFATNRAPSKDEQE